MSGRHDIFKSDAESLRLSEVRDAVIEAAVSDGKFTAARAEHYRKAWDADPEATNRLIGRLAGGLTATATEADAPIAASAPGPDMDARLPGLTPESQSGPVVFGKD